MSHHRCSNCTEYFHCPKCSLAIRERIEAEKEREPSTDYARGRAEGAAAERSRILVLIARERERYSESDPQWLALLELVQQIDPRRPLPPEVLAGALQDGPHLATGALRAAVRVKR